MFPDLGLVNLVFISGLVCATTSESVMCPDSSQWSLRTRAFCNSTHPSLNCLYEETTSTFVQFCTPRPDFQRPGYKFIIRGNIDGIECEKNRFQPIKFWTNGSSDCILEKTRCNEPGQVIHVDGDSKSDRTCRCDYTKGFAFVSQKQGDCFCDPSLEDCSCFLKPCRKFQVMTPDYSCIDAKDWTGIFKCPVIKKTVYMTTSATTRCPTPSTEKNQFRMGLMVATKLDTIALTICSALTVIIVVVVIIFHRKIKECNYCNNMTQEDYNENIPQFNRELNIKYIRDWEQDDEQFIATDESNNAADLVRKNNMIMLQGGRGCGKSSILRHIAVQLKKDEGFDIVPIVMVPLIIKLFCNQNRKQVFVVDDFCGRDRINSTAVDLWVLPEYVNLFSKIISSSPDYWNNSNATAKILIGCGEATFNDPLFKNLGFYSQCVVNLKNFPLSKIEQDVKVRKIAHYANAITVDEKIRETFGFPLLCKLSIGKSEKQVKDFFANPIKSIKQDVNKLKQQHNLQFCALVLCALLDNQFHENWFQIRNAPKRFQAAIINVIQEFNLEYWQDSEMHRLKKNFQLLENSYLSKTNTSINTQNTDSNRSVTNQVYRIIHPQIYDIIAVICGQQFLDCFITYASSDFIARRFVFELPINIHDICKTFIQVSKENKKKYFDRTIKDLERGVTLSFLHNTQLQNDVYRKEFIAHCNVRSTNIKQLLGKLRDKKKGKSQCIINHEYLKDSKNITFEDIMHPLIESVIGGYEDLVKMLIDVGCDVNETHKFGISALYVASVLGNKPVIRLLLCENADVKMRDHKGCSALFAASIAGHSEVVRLLLDHEANVSEYDDKGRSPLHAASAEGHADVVRALLDADVNISHRDNSGKTPIFTASANGSFNVVDILLQHGASISTKDNDEMTPFIVACKNGMTEVVKMLLINGADVTECDKFGRTPLCIASSKGHSDIVKQLIEFHADIAACDSEGMSPLYLSSKEGHKETVQILLKKNAKTDQCDEEDLSPLHVACQNNYVDIAEELINQGAIVNTRDHKGRSPLYVSCEKERLELVTFLLNKNADINVCDKNKVSPLHVACSFGYSNIVFTLIQNKANVSNCNKWERSPLYEACKVGNYDIVNILLENNADIDKQDTEGQTPLHAACDKGHVNIVRLLLEKTANMSLSDSNKRTPILVAYMQGHTDIVNVLLEKEANSSCLDKENRKYFDDHDYDIGNN